MKKTYFETCSCRKMAQLNTDTHYWVIYRESLSHHIIEFGGNVISVKIARPLAFIVSRIFVSPTLHEHKHIRLHACTHTLTNTLTWRQGHILESTLTKRRKKGDRPVYALIWLSRRPCLRTRWSSIDSARLHDETGWRREVHHGQHQLLR